VNVLRESVCVRVWP